MTHLGADVAAYVDAQLSSTAMRAAYQHLETCETCSKAVRQQRLLKSRMSTVTTPEPAAELLASLSGLAARPPRRPSWWERVRRSIPFRAGVAVAGASMAVMFAAYVPATATRAGATISDTKLDDLQSNGWPCHKQLGGDLDRTSGSWAEDAVALSYSDGTAKLNLFEQTGVLDHSTLQGFESTRIAKSVVWIRPGSPMVVTWDYEGVVYTIVTDAE